MIPKYAMALLLNVPEDQVEARAAGSVEDVIKSLANSFSASHINKGRCTLSDLIAYSGMVGREEEQTRAGKPSTPMVASYLRHVGQRAAENKARSNAAKGRVPAAIDPRLKDDEDIRSQDGSSAAPSRLVALKWLSNTLKMDFGVDSMVVQGAVNEMPRKADEPAPPITVGIIIRLHQLTDDATLPIPVRYQASDWLAIIYSSSRLEQAQMTDLQAEDSEIASGVTLAKGSKKKPRSCLVTIPKAGVVPGSRWFSTFKEGRQAGCSFMLRDVKGGGGNPYDPSVTGMANRGADYKRASASLRGLLTHGCGLSAEQAELFTPHSARHTLPHVAMLRGERAEDRAEIGAWYGSVLQDKDMIPQMRSADRRGALMAMMPDHYAQKPKAKHVRRIMLRQVGAIQTAAQTQGAANIPMLGGWSMFD